MKYIDLTMPLSSATPVYPGDPKVDIKTCAKVAKDGYLDHIIRMGTHNGTHIDAPAHMIEGGSTLSDFSVDNFIGRAVTIDVRNGMNIKSFESAVIHGGDIVLIYTGTSEHFENPNYYSEHPVLADEMADFLVDRKVKMVGVDTGSVDKDPFRVHKKLLKNDILIIENLVNLKSTLNKEVMIYAFPLNLSVEGSPARVVAGFI